MQHIEMDGRRNHHIDLLATPEEEALLMQAAEMAHLDINSFIMRTAVTAAQDLVERPSHDTQQKQQATGDRSQNTGKDLIAFFRNSPLADVILELDLERDKTTSRTITF